MACRCDREEEEYHQRLTEQMNVLLDVTLQVPYWKKKFSYLGFHFHLLDKQKVQVHKKEKKNEREREKERNQNFDTHAHNNNIQFGKSFFLLVSGYFSN